MELVCFILIIMFPFAAVYADYQGDALVAFKNGLVDPTNALMSWEDGLIGPCTWFHVSCEDGTSNVTRVDLGNSGLAGPLVADLGSLSTLQYLELFNNKINGSIPAELGNLTNLVSFDLFGNSLTGSIPPELGNLKNLRFLRLNDNNLSGVVPEALKNIPILNLSGNPYLCGPFTNPYKSCS